MSAEREGNFPKAAGREGFPYWGSQTGQHQHLQDRKGNQWLLKSRPIGVTNSRSEFTGSALKGQRIVSWRMTTTLQTLSD